MRPVAYIVVHPSKLSVVESILYTKALRPAVEISAMQNLLTQRGLFGAEFAACMAALWTGINGSPSWRMRSVLDAYEGLEACIAGYTTQLGYLAGDLIPAQMRTVYCRTLRMYGLYHAQHYSRKANERY